MAVEEQQVMCKSKLQWKCTQELALKRLPKRLAYILRYGALKEGLEVDDNGYVELDKLLDVSLLQDYTREEVLTSIKTSIGYRVIPRYNWYEKDGNIYVRASYLRKFEKSPFHPGTKVRTLFECAMTQILGHLDDYDLQDFPDEYIIRTMIHRLKRQKKLNVKALKTLLVPTITNLDLEDIYLTSNTLRTVWIQCPNLTAVSLKHCGYIVTDSMLAQFTKNLPKLQRLNLCYCNHLTFKCLTILSKNLPQLQILHIVKVPSLTYEAVLNFITGTRELKFLDVYHLKTKPEEFHNLMKVASDKDLKLVLREPRKEIDKKFEEEKEEGEFNFGAEDDDDDSPNEESQEALCNDATADDLWGMEAGNVWYEGYDNVHVYD